MKEVIEGKTKRIVPLKAGAHVGSVKSMSAITAGDGARQETMAGKDMLATRTTCNVFEFLRRRGVPVAYIGRDGPNTFITRLCEMIPVEVVGRSIATGSYCKRYPEVADCTSLKFPVIELFYKTTGRRIGNLDLPCDDPMLIQTGDYEFHLYRPDVPQVEGYISRLEISSFSATLLSERLEKCKEMAFHINNLLHDAWQMLGGIYFDCKFEFGVLPDGTVVMADVVDCDSWRVELSSRSNRFATEPKSTKCLPGTGWLHH